METNSLNRVLADFLPRIEDACRAGKGRELVHDYFRAVAADLADKVFLKMDAVVAKASPDQARELLEWVEAYPEARGVDLLRSIDSTFRAFHGTDEDVRVATEIAATAFRERLEHHFLNAPAGGRA